jgi:hypothetical protein
MARIRNVETELPDHVASPPPAAAPSLGEAAD